MDRPWHTDYTGYNAPSATLECAAGPVWLYGSAAAGTWVAGYLGETPAAVTLSTPQGTATVTGMGPGTLLWYDGEAVLDAEGELAVQKG